MGINKRSLQRGFSNNRSSTSSFTTKKNNEAYLVIGDTYYPGGSVSGSLLCDSHLKYTQLYRFTDKEKLVEINEDLLHQIKLGISIKSITSDGYRAIIKAISQDLQILQFKGVCYTYIACAIFIIKPNQTLGSFNQLEY